MAREERRHISDALRRVLSSLKIVFKLLIVPSPTTHEIDLKFSKLNVDFFYDLMYMCCNDYKICLIIWFVWDCPVLSTELL